ncbi:AIR synthase family protein [Pedobacter sp.]|uniref:AIR synthase family protein n=1 Tax=Pedobacter sp. TaxID=1411316 RepID=UPI003BA93252
MGSGKINNEEFEDVILKKTGIKRSEVYCGPSFGIDVSIVNLPDGLAMAMTSDPLTLIPSLGLQESAWLSVHLMANDMATTGFAPMYAQMVLNLPISLTEKDFSTYWDFIHQYCQSIGVSITGGHTGRIQGQNSTIAGGGTMVLIAPAQSILLSRYARQDDFIIVTKECAISSTAILAMSFPETVKNKAGIESYNVACKSFYQTSSLAEALIARKVANGVIRAMHDVTEGGILGAVYEMAIASGNGVEIDNSAIPISQTVRDICDLFSIDPRFSIGAGSMVMAVDKTMATGLVETLSNHGIQASIIGKFTPRENGYKLIDDEKSSEITYYPTDPYWHAFFIAQQKGWK